jgi:hypothetical protein
MMYPMNHHVQSNDTHYSLLHCLLDLVILFRSPIKISESSLKPHEETKYIVFESCLLPFF